MKTRSKKSAKQLPKGITPAFVDSIQSMSTDELKAQIVILQVQNDENEVFKQSEGFLKAKEEFDYARDRHAEVVGPVKDVTIAIKNKTKLIIERLREKGAV